MTRHGGRLNNMISARWRAIAMGGAGKHRSIGFLVATARYRPTRKTQEGQWQNQRRRPWRETWNETWSKRHCYATRKAPTSSSDTAVLT